MRRPIVVPALTLILAALAGCATDAPAPTSPDAAAVLSKGRPGSGVSDPTARFYLTATQGPLGIWGDGLYTDGHPDNLPQLGGRSRYLDGECGVASKIFATTAASNSGDAIMDPARVRNCAASPRTVRIDFGGPVEASGAVAAGIQTVTARFNVIGLQNSDPSTIIPVGVDRKRPLNIELTGSSTCDRLRFREDLPAYGLSAIGADSVTVRRVDARTWHVTNGGSDRAACIKGTQVVGRYHIPVDFYVVASSALPVQ